MRLPARRSVSLVLAMALSVRTSLGADHKDGELFDRVGQVKIFDGDFIGGEGCNITLKIDGEKDAIGLQVVNDSPVGKALAGLRDKQARVQGKWRFHKGDEASDYWYVDVDSAVSAR